MKKKTKVLLGVSISIIVVIIGCIIAGIIIKNTPKEHTVSGIGLYNLNLFINDNFSENIEEKEKAKSETITENELLEYLEDLKSKNKIKDYKQEERGIVVDLTEGGVFIFQFDLPDGYQANSKDTVSNRNVNNLSVSEDGTTLSVLTAQPSESELQSDVFDNSARAIENSELGYKFTDNIDNTDITIDFMKTLSKYKVIIWDGHGGWFSDYHSILQIGEIHSDNIEKYSDDINSKRLIAFNNGTYAITSSFFDYYYNDNSFNGTLIYLGCCDGAMDSVLSDTLIKKGAEAVLAYNNVVYSGYNRNMCETIFNELVKKDGETNSTKTVSEAFETAKKQNGNKDTTNTSWIDWFRGTYNKKANRAELILTENDDNSFRLVDENKKEDNKTTTTEKETTTEINSIDIYNAYLEKINEEWDNIKRENPNDSITIEYSPTYMIYDIDNNGVKELIINTGTNESNINYDFYTYNNGLISLGSIPCGHSRLSIPEDKNGLYMNYGHMDISHLYHLTLENGKIKKETIYENKDYEYASRYKSILLEEYHASETDKLLELLGIKSKVQSTTAVKETTTKKETSTSKENTTTQKVTTTEKVTSTNNFKYELIDNGNVEITGYIGRETKINIPSNINGNKVTSIGKRAFIENTVLLDVTIPNTINNIDDSAFYGCSNLKSITIPNSVTYIGWGAFGFCTNLEKVYYIGTKDQWNEINFDFENDLLLNANIQYNK